LHKSEVSISIDIEPLIVSQKLLGLVKSKQTQKLMNKQRRRIPGNPKPGSFCQISGQYVMVFSYFQGGRKLVGKNEITCVKGRRFPPYGKLILLPSHVVLLTSKVKPKGYYLTDKTKGVY
jgi:hypothetical protein